ncbi:GNAT family N-acetyltransferase [Nocardioides sp. JQ2195]|uniref:GNAT family N-acetyltransferase n=1 Tax=Nocardioides sp. JQ2195 TaxID=2592334 RepID=UPI00143E5760|nr:GNAT family N-acetyltransferase [Nocardioides sp. JQ2195]QIX27807.1 GNAT family N-acetyltransferase [Nocardioides sp. JQ2195]
MDTDRFGFRVSRITVPSAATDVNLDDVLDAVHDDPSDVWILRYPARQNAWFAELMRRGFDVLFADSLTYWALEAGSGRTPQPVTNASVSPAGEAPSGLVDELVADAFHGYGNHYTADPLFDPALALAGYQDWARRAIKSGDSLLLNVLGEPVGLMISTTGTDTSEMLLGGVVASQQGRGWYAHILSAVETAALRKGAHRVVSSTQSHNTNGQRAWARYGFEPIASHITVHLRRST